MKPFKDTYVMYQLLEFIDESSIIALCKASEKLNEICKSYIKLEDDKRFETITNWDIHDNSTLLEIFCENNDLIKIRKMIKMDLYWTWGLLGACENGHIDIVKLIIEKGAHDWEYGLYYACFGGNIATVQLIIEKGANDWNFGLVGACRSNHIDIIQLMIEKGADYCEWCDKSIEEHLS